jgi:MFS family permease
MAYCTHLDQIRTVTPLSEGCADCNALGETWIQLRLCRTCGYVGCCEESKHRHAARHFHTTRHPIIQSHVPGESWSWCYLDEALLDLGPDQFPPVESADRSKSVIQHYLLIAGLYTLSTSLIWGVNTLFLLEAGLDLMAVSIVNAIFTGSMAMFEIPTGILADARGRRLSFLISVVVLIIGTLGYVAAASTGRPLLLFGLLSVVLGLGFTFYSGAVEAWFVDALQATGYRKQLDRVFALGSLVTGGAMLIGSVGGGLLGSINLALPYLARSGLLAGVLGVAFFMMYDRGFTPQTMRLREMPAAMSAIARQSIVHGWKQRSVRLLMIAALIQSVFAAWGFYAWQPYFLDLLGEHSIWVAGAVAALIALATMVGNTLVGWLSRYCGRRTTLMLWAAAIQTVAAVGVGFAGSFWVAVGLYLLVMSTTGVWAPVRQSYLHKSIPSRYRASVVSFDSLLSSTSSMVGQFGLGGIAHTLSIPAGYVVGGLASLPVLPVILRLRRLGAPADVIIGTAGKRGVCAAQGLPSVAALDPNTPVVTIAAD